MFTSLRAFFVKRFVRFYLDHLVVSEEKEKIDPEYYLVAGGFV